MIVHLLKRAVDSPFDRLLIDLRLLMSRPALSQLFLAKMTERLSRTHVSDLPRFAGVDQASLRDLRTAQDEA